MIVGWYMIRLPNGNYFSIDEPVNGVPFCDANALWFNPNRIARYAYPERGEPERISGAAKLPKFINDTWINTVIITPGHTLFTR